MPATIVETEIVKDAVRSACRAPSLHNIQPWQWVLDGDGRLQLFLDQSRVLRSDRSDRQAIIGCGAALDHLRVAMAAAGWQAHVDRFPNPDRSNHLASIHFTPLNCITEEHRRHAKAIWARRSDRLPFAAPTNWDALDPVLHNALDRDGVRLDVLADDERPRLARASEIADSLRLYDPCYQAELRQWTGPFAFSEGIPYGSLVSAAEGERVDVRRAFPVAHHTERRAWLLRDDATILVLSTDTDDRADALATGEALSTLLLECTIEGLASCPLTHLTEVRVTREMVTTIVGGDAMPQILVRVGLTLDQEEIPPPTPRRQLEEVLRVAIRRSCDA